MKKTIDAIDSKYKLANNAYQYVLNDNYDFLETYSATSIYYIMKQKVPAQTELGNTIFQKLNDLSYLQTLAIDDLYYTVKIFENLNGAHNEKTTKNIRSCIETFSFDSFDFQDCLAYIYLSKSSGAQLPKTLSIAVTQKLQDFSSADFSLLQLCQAMLTAKELQIPVASTMEAAYRERKTSMASVVQFYYVLLTDHAYQYENELTDEALQAYKTDWGYSISANDSRISIYTTMCGILSEHILADEQFTPLGNY